MSAWAGTGHFFADALGPPLAPAPPGHAAVVEQPAVPPIPVGA